LIYVEEFDVGNDYRIVQVCLKDLLLTL